MAKPFSIEDVLNQFGQLFAGMASPSPANPKRGSDLARDLEISLEQVVRGDRVDVELDRSESCSACSESGDAPGEPHPTCNACLGRGLRAQISGQFRNEQRCNSCDGRGRLGAVCPACGGSGLAPRRERVRVTIPPGVDDGTRLRLEGKGEGGRHGGAAGDFYLCLRVRPHATLRREGKDLVFVARLTPSEAKQGGALDVPLPDGPRRVPFPAEVAEGRELRLRGHGLPKLGVRSAPPGDGPYREPDGLRGDLIVRFHIAEPKQPWWKKLFGAR
jgi:molecular chaperone DnaJ